MKRKRLLCAILAFLLPVSAAFPAYASEAGAPESVPETLAVPLGASAEPEEIPPAVEDEASLIHVSVPQIGTIIINPYHMTVEMDGGTSDEQIVSETMVIENESAIPVLATASITGYTSGEVRYVSAPPQPNATEKEIFLYVEFQNEDGLWSGAYTDGANQILVSSQPSEPKEVLSLDGESQGVFRLFGATSTYPKNAWNVEDKISVTVAFTFSPVADPEPALISDEEPVEPETSVSEETPVPEETPALEENPVSEETPALEETPVPEETPALEETPVPEETPALEETPAPEETPALEEMPAPEETPALEETPAPEETPALEESPEPEPSLEPESPAPESEPLPESDALPSETTSY